MQCVSDECHQHSQDIPTFTCCRLYFQVQLIKWVCSRRSRRGIQSTNAHPGLPSRGQMMSSPMGSSESQKQVFMSWVQTLRTLESSRIIGCEDSKGLELLGSCEFLMSNVQRCADNFALRRVSSIPASIKHSQQEAKFSFSFWRLPLDSDKRGQKVKKVVLKQVSVKVGSSLPVRCMASWAKSAESKYPMLTWAWDRSDYK